MIYKSMSAVEAVQHFAKSSTWFDLWPGNRNGKNKEYSRCAKIIQDAQAGSVSDERARWLLWTYGGLLYRVSSTFEVAVIDGNGPCFAELTEEFRKRYPNAFAQNEEAKAELKCPQCWADCEERHDLESSYDGKRYKYSAMVCTADPSHEWQTGVQIDATLEILKEKQAPAPDFSSEGAAQ